MDGLTESSHAKHTRAPRPIKTGPEQEQRQQEEQEQHLHPPFPTHPPAAMAAAVAASKPSPTAAPMQSKSASSLRWAILVCASLLMLSNYYVYDVPASL
jgi:hypothetical protein